MKQVTSPEVFREAVKQLVLIYGDDIKTLHGRFDDLCHKVLTELGYQDGIRIIKKIPVWYS
jgi:hypothetical protein